MKRNNLLLGLIILITIFQLPEVKAWEEAISFSESLNWNEWFIGNDFYLKEGDAIFINLEIDSINWLFYNETNLEVYVDSPSDPKYHYDTINADDYDWTFCSYIFSWSCEEGDEGLTHFKFLCTGNNLTWINISGIQYHYENTLLSLKDVNICNDYQFNGSQEIIWNFHPDIDNDSCYIWLWFKPDSHNTDTWNASELIPLDPIDEYNLCYPDSFSFIENNSYSYFFDYRDHIFDENGSLLHSNGTFLLEVAEVKSDDKHHEIWHSFTYTVYFNDPRLKYETVYVTETKDETIYVNKTNIITEIIYETSIVERTKATTDFAVILVIVLALLGILVKRWKKGS